MYVYHAIQRTKENEVIHGPRVMREVMYEHQSEEEIISFLKARCSLFPATWRIYRSLNKRDLVKAKLELIDTLTRQLVLPLSVTDKTVESLWKTILMQPRNKGEKLFLIDLDSKDVAIKHEILSDPRITVVSVTETPNGYHVVCEPFDSRIIEKWQDVASINKDALLYICTL